MAKPFQFASAASYVHPQEFAAARALRHQAWRSLLRLSERSRVRGMYFVDIQIDGSVRARIASAFCATACGE